MQPLPAARSCATYTSNPPPVLPSVMTEMSQDLEDYLKSIPPVSAEDLEELTQAVSSLDDDPSFQADLIKGQFVEAILQAMDARGQTQSQVAASWGKSRQYLSKVLNEDRRVNFTVETMTQLAHVVGRRLRVTVEEPAMSGASFTSHSRPGAGQSFPPWDHGSVSWASRGTNLQAPWGCYHELNLNRHELIQHEDFIAA